MVNGDRSCLLHNPVTVTSVSTDGWSRAVPWRDTTVPLMGRDPLKMFKVGGGTEWKNIYHKIIFKSR